MNFRIASLIALAFVSSQPYAKLAPTNLHNFNGDNEEQSCNPSGDLSTDKFGTIAGSVSRSTYPSQTFTYSNEKGFSFLGSPGVGEYAGPGAVGGMAILKDGSYWGEAAYGGTYSSGYLYKVDPAGISKIVYNFNPAKGEPVSPAGGLLRGLNGKLYGTSQTGGRYGFGTIFQFDPVANKLQVLHSFNLFDGTQVNHGLIQGSDGTLYGVASNGGIGNAGTVFSLDALGGFRIIAMFPENTGSGATPYYPVGKLYIDSENSLIGVTAGGGAYDYNMGGQTLGTIYKIKDGQMSVMVYSSALLGKLLGGLVQGPDAKLYGVSIYPIAGGLTETRIYSWDSVLGLAIESRIQDGFPTSFQLALAKQDFYMNMRSGGLYNCGYLLRLRRSK